MFLGLRVGIPMQGAGGLWSPYSPALAALLAEASSSGLVLDFTRNIAFRSGTQSTITGVSGWTYTRSGTAYDLAGTTSFAANTLRRTSAGLLCEPGATNLFLNSDVGATQSITLTAVQHVLSFQGTGSITLSGTATGTLNGTGANQFVSLAFTPTAGSVTFTVSGSVTFVQVEISASGFRSSYIPTGGASASRGADAVVINPFVMNGPYTMIAVVNDVNAPAGTRLPLTHSDGTFNNAIYLSQNGNLSTLNIREAAAVVGAPTVTTSYSAGRNRFAARLTSGNNNIARNGSVTTDNTGAGTFTSMNRLSIGNDWGGAGGNSFNGIIELVAMLPRGASNAELQAATA